MNNAFQEEPAHPHVHWHIFPRYKQAPVLAGITFDDPLYGHHYDPRAKRMVTDEVVEKIAEKLKVYL
jgi:diadenosine tetraphosphate (Ap4A) HIT family hydrolase